MCSAFDGIKRLHKIFTSINARPWNTTMIVINVINNNILLFPYIHPMFHKFIDITVVLISKRYSTINRSFHISASAPQFTLSDLVSSDPRLAFWKYS